MPEAIISPTKRGTAQYIRRSFWDAGVDEFTKPPAQNPDLFETLNNVVVGVEPRITRRPGTTLFSNPTIDARRIYEAHFSNERNRFILTAADGSGALGNNNKVVAINENGDLVTVTGPIFTPSANDLSDPLNPKYTQHPHATPGHSYVYFLDGIAADQYTWNTADEVLAAGVVTKWGIDTPNPTPISTLPGINGASTAEGTGEIRLTTGRAYTIAYRNSTKGHTSDIAPFTNRLGVVSDPADEDLGVNIELFDIPTSLDPQVDQVVILGTSDGGALDTLYEVAIIANGVNAYTDIKSEQELLDSPIWNEINEFGEEVGVIGNTPPSDIAPDATISCIFRERMFLLSGHFIYWSKSLAEVTTSDGTVTGAPWECFPAENQTSISSNGSELGTMLKTDDFAMYIGTNRSLYIMDTGHPGTHPPRALFQEVGVLNNEVFKTVYHEGRASGAVWLTPDKRAIYSDYATYTDIGIGIQTSLSNLGDVQKSATSLFWADGQKELYIVSGGGSLLILYVFNIKTKQWMKWFSPYANDQIHALGYMFDARPATHRALPIFSTTSSRIYRWNPETAYDHSSEAPLLSAPSIVTSWLDLGEPEAIKTLNAVEIMTDEPSAELTVYAARNEADFDANLSLATRPFTENIFGALWCPLADLSTRHRYYKFEFSGFNDSAETDILSYFSILFKSRAHL